MSSDSVSVEFETVGAEDAIKAVEDYIASIEGLEKASGIDMSPLTDGLDTVNKSAEENISVIENVIKSLEGLEPGFQAGASGAGELGSSMGEANAVLQEGQSTLDAYVPSLDATATGIEAVTTVTAEGVATAQEYTSATAEEAAASEELASGITPLGQLMEDTATATGGLNTALVENTSQLTETAGAAGEASAAISELGPIFSDAGTTASGASESFTTFVGEASALGDAVEATSGPLTEQNTLMENLATTTPDATSAMSELGAEAENMSGQVESSASSWQTLDSSMGATIGFMGSAASGAIGLVQGFVRLEQAQNRVEASSLKVSRAQEALTKAQQKLNTLRASGTASAAELAAAELDVSQASEALSVAQGRLEIQQTNLNLRMASFYAEIAPNIISAVTGTIAGISQMPGAFGKVSQAMGLTRTSTDEFSVSADGASLSSQELGIDLGETEAQALNLGGTAQTATGSISGLGTGMSTAGKFAAGFGIAAIAASAAVAIISTNAFGARDALNQFGEALGNAVPPLEGLLVGIQNLAVDIGIAGDDAKASVEDFRSLEEQVKGMGEGMVTAGQHLQEVDSRFKTTGTAVEELGNTVSTVGPHLVKETATWGDAINKFADAIAKRDWDAAWDLIIAGVASVGTAIWDSVQIVGDAINVGYAAQFDALVEIVTVAAGLIYSGLTKVWDGIVSFVGGKVAELVAAINKMATDVSISVQDWWNATNLKAFFDEAVPLAVQKANEIKAAFDAAVAAAGKAIGMPQTPAEGPAPRQLPAAQRQPQVEEGPFAENTRLANENTTAINNNAAAQATLTSRFTGTIAGGQRLTTSLSGLVGGYNAAEGGIKTASNSLASYITQGLVTQQANQGLAASTVPVVDNFGKAKDIFPEFNTALDASKGIIADLPPKWTAYGAAIQTATDAGLQIPPSILASTTATEAFGKAVEENTGHMETNLGAASGYIASVGELGNVTKPTGQEVINFSNALKAGVAELERVTVGQQAANAQVKGTQAAYAAMTPEVFNSALAYQEEARTLAMGNILREDTKRGTIALSEAQTAGTQKGVEFANSQFTAQASLTGYKEALSQAAFGNKDYAATLGLTAQQLEQTVSFQNDVKAAQEGLIDSGSELVHSQTVQIEAWRTMSQEQLNNLNAVNSARLALTSLNSPLADNAENMQKVNEAFIAGREAANDFVLGLRTTSAETDGYKQRLNELIPAQEQVGDTASYTAEQMEMLASAFSNTEAGLRTMTSAMLEASNNFMGMLKFDPEVLHTKIDDAFADVPDWIRDTMSRGLQGGIVAQGDIDRLGTQFVDMTGAAIVGAFRTDNPFEHIREFATSMLQTFDELDPQVAAALEPMKKHLVDIANTAQVNLPPTREQLEALGQSFTGLVVEAQRAKDPFLPFYESIGRLNAITPEMAANMVQLEGGLASMGLQGQSAALELGKVGEVAGAGQVPIVELTDKATGLTTTFANVGGQLVPVNTGLQDMVGPAQLAGGALLGVGTAANAINIRLGDIREGFTNVGADLLILGQAFIDSGQIWSTSIGTAVNAINIRLGDIREGFLGIGTDMLALTEAWVIMWEGFPLQLDTASVAISTKWVALMTTLNTSAQQYGTLIATSLFSGLSTQFTVQQTTLLTAWTTLMTTLNTSAVQWGTLIAMSLFGTLNQQLTIQQTILLTTWTTLMTTFNTSAVQWGTLIGMSLWGTLNQQLTIQQTLLLTTWTTLMTTFNTSALQWGVLIGMSLWGTLNQQLVINQTLMLTTWTTLMTTLNTSALQWGVLISMSLWGTLNQQLTINQTLLLTTWTTLMTTLNTSAIQWGTLIGTSLGTGISTGMTTAQTTMMTSWVTMMTTLQTSATQYGAIIGMALGQTFVAALTAHLAIALTTWTTHMSTLASSASQYGGLIATNFGTAFTPKWTQILTQATQAFVQFAADIVSEAQSMTQEVISLMQDMQSEFESVMDAMSQAVQQFASDFASAMQEVASSADEARQAVEELQSAIDNLQDKTVTITVQYKEVGKPSGLQHGGAFIQNYPTKLGGVKIGEHHKPELVTVTPLTNPNRNTDRTIDASRFMSAPTTTTGMQRGGRIIAPAAGGDTETLFKSLIAEVRQMRVNFRDMKIMSTTVLDSQIIDQRIQQRRVRRTENFG